MQEFIRKRLIAIFIILVILIVLFSPWEFSYSLNYTGKIYPARKLLLIKGGSGQLIRSVFNFRTGIGESYSGSQFERGESMSFEISPQIRRGQTIQKGDTLGVIRSSSAVEEITRLEGELDIARANLQVSMSGEKDAVIQQAGQELEQVKAKVRIQQNVVNRLEGLYKNQLVSDEEYQIARDELQALLAEQNVKSAALQSVISGEKSQLIDLQNAEIRALENELKILKERLRHYLLTAPFNGIVETTFSADTLLQLLEFSQPVVVFMFPVSRSGQLTKEAEISIVSEHSNEKFRAKIVSLGSEIFQAQGKQFFNIIAETETNIEQLMPGLLVMCEIRTKPVRIFDIVRYWWTEGI